MTVNYHEIIKRDGTRERFDVIKIVNAIQKSAWSTGVELDYELVKREITSPIEEKVSKGPLTVEEVQDMVEMALMQHYPVAAKSYILYREARTRERDSRK